MADMFDPIGIQQRLESSFTELDSSKKDVIDTVAKSNQQVRTLDEQYLQTLRDLRQQSDSALDEMGNAQQSIVEITKNPPIINRIMTAFGDEDFSVQHQAARLEAAQTKQLRTQNRLDTATKQYTVGVNMAKGEAAAKLAEHDLLRSQFTDVSTAVNTVSQVMAVEAQRRSTMLSRMSDADVQAMAAGKKELPASLTAGHIEAEAKRRQQLNTEMELSQLAMQSGKRDLAVTKQNDALTRYASTSELSKALEASQGTGTATLYGADVTTQQLQSALAAAKSRDRELLNKSAELAVMDTDYEQANASINSSVAFLARNADGLNVDPENPQNSLSPAIRAEVEATQKAVDRMISLGAVQKAVERQKQLEEKLRAEVDATIERMPKDEQSAAKQFAFERGQISPANAQDALVSFATDKNAIQEGPLAPYWDRLSDYAHQRLTEYSATGGSMQFNPADGTFMQGPKKLPAEVLATDIAEFPLAEYVDPNTGETKKVTAVDAYGDIYTQKFFASQFEAMAKNDKAFEVLIDKENGGLSADQYEMQPDGSYRWNPQVTIDKVLGLYQNNTTALAEALQRMQANIPQFSNRLDQSAATNHRQASMNQLVYGNRSMPIIRRRFQAITKHIGVQAQQKIEAAKRNATGSGPIPVIPGDVNEFKSLLGIQPDKV